MEHRKIYWKGEGENVKPYFVHVLLLGEGKAAGHDESPAHQQETGGGEGEEDVRTGEQESRRAGGQESRWAGGQERRRAGE